MPAVKLAMPRAQIHRSVPGNRRAALSKVGADAGWRSYGVSARIDPVAACCSAEARRFR